MSPLSAALAQLVVLEAEQFADLEKTRAAIAALEKLSGPAVEAAPVSPVPSNRAISRPAPAARRAPSPPTESAALVKGHLGTAAAIARATALLRLIGAGTRQVADLRAALPVPDGATPLQHRQSIANALTRLKADGFLVNREDGWALTAKGRTRAAKEAP